MRKNLKRALIAAGRWTFTAQHFEQTVFLVASASLGYGLYLISEAGAFIGMGALFLFLSVWDRRAE